jgi:hypothetical protein
LAVIIGYFEFKKGEVTRRPMINPFLQDNVEASLLLNGGLLDFVNGDIDSAKEKIEDSLKVMKRWKKKHD